MDQANNESDEFILCINYESKKENINCKMSDIINNTLNKFALKINQDISSFVILYSGKNLSNEYLNLPFSRVISKLDKKTKLMNILIIKQSNSTIIAQNNINIKLKINTTDIITLQGKREEKIKDIILRNISKIDKNLNYSSFTYNNKEIDINKKFNDIANNNDKISGTIIINLDTNSLKVYFVNEKDERIKIDCDKKDKIKNKCIQYCQQVNINLKDLYFKYGMIPVNLEETFEQLISKVSFSSNKADERLDTEENFKNTNEIGDNEIEIRAFKNNSCFKRHKKKIIIISSIILIIIIISLIIYFILRKKRCNVGYKLNYGKCEPDFLIKAIYNVKNNDDTIILFHKGDSPYIKKIIIEDEEITPSHDSHLHRFKNAGNNTVYYKFIQCNYDSSNSYFFSGIENLISVTFSDFDEYLSDISLEFLFSNCVDLLEVDLSKMNIAYYYKMNGMFNGCVKLKYINLNFERSKISTNMQYMFLNCKSLKSIDLSKLDVSRVTYFDNMFNGCTSLEEVNLKSFKLYSKQTNISNMFYNCISLKSVDLSSFRPFYLRQMNSIFYNCNSLTSINLKGFDTSQMTIMESLFFNCSSLKYIDLSDFNTEKVTNMNSMFEYCTSLTSINFGNYFDTNKVKRMNSMFRYCHSLEKIDFPSKFKVKIENLTTFFLIVIL